MMKFSISLLFALVAVLVLPSQESSAFAPVAQTFVAQSSVCSSSALSMGLFDMFSKEAKEERERKKRRVIEEQERLQKEIMDRRRNPEKMEEYEYKTQVRRELRMEGKDDEAAQVAAKIYEGADDQTLLNGAKPTE
mmetsp:Transcript_9186/g.19268  ORF Transcript_9186/g.19268 Transcript_9186/m.19268 type:complete len:136 (-) Transcript_9186:432-839(-)|eukprot:CAMPEP_0201126138 /NCGR_PEP_ID=MMETSP0850-20130426/24827_1 /ASSEMBLY_ACC=CAM_ASM_000622 /TAXON_ID=183588 /ORGANISM="Pseudo-nitzschia fraudulenta, Strain WWA7" /LENGTH=135 /DNA_ID=CAMNT_0047394443 /DNA_START=11 /DNA_END=418 /DNA_ORIENTATION=+